MCSAKQLSIIATSFRDLAEFQALNRAVLEALSERDDIEMILVDTSGLSFEHNPDVSAFFDNLGNCKFRRTHKPEKQGVGRNIGIREAQGRYVWFIDSDDEIFLPEKSDLAAFFADVVTCNYIYEQPNTNLKVVVNGSKGLDLASACFLLSCNRLSNACWPYLYKKSVIEDNFVFNDIYFEDMIFNAEVFNQAVETIEHHSQPLYSYNYNAVSTSRRRDWTRTKQRLVASFKGASAVLNSRNLGFPERYITTLIYVIYHGVWANIRR